MQNRCGTTTFNRRQAKRTTRHVGRPGGIGFFVGMPLRTQHTHGQWHTRAESSLKRR